MIVSRAKEDNRSGFTWIESMGSFFAFDNNNAELMDCELLWCLRKFEDERMKTFSCCHVEDFGEFDYGKCANDAEVDLAETRRSREEQERERDGAGC